MSKLRLSMVFERTCCRPRYLNLRRVEVKGLGDLDELPRQGHLYDPLVSRLLWAQTRWDDVVMMKTSSLVYR